MPQFEDTYHQRSIVESVFSSFKCRLTAVVRVKKPATQRLQLLLRRICWNCSAGGFCVGAACSNEGGCCVARDCDHVRSVSNMEGITRLQKIRDGVLTEDIHETLAFIGDTGRVIAWLWLMHKGYVETYA